MKIMKNKKLIQWVVVASQNNSTLRKDCSKSMGNLLECFINFAWSGLTFSVRSEQMSSFIFRGEGIKTV